MTRHGAMLLAVQAAYTGLNYDWKAAEIRYYFEHCDGRRRAEALRFPDALGLVLPGNNLTSLLRLYGCAGMSVAEMGEAIISAARSYYDAKIKDNDTEEDI